MNMTNTYFVQAILPIDIGAVFASDLRIEYSLIDLTKSAAVIDLWTPLLIPETFQQSCAIMSQRRWPSRSRAAMFVGWRQSNALPTLYAAWAFGDAGTNTLTANEASNDPITPDELDRSLRQSGADDWLRNRIVYQRTLKTI